MPWLEHESAFAHSHMRSPHEKELMGTTWFPPTLLGDVWAKWLVCLSWERSVSPVAALRPAMITGSGLHEKTKHSVNESVCSFPNTLLPKELPTHYDCRGGCFSKRKKSSRSSVGAFYGIQSPGRLACSTPEPWERTEMAAEPWAPRIWGV